MGHHLNRLTVDIDAAPRQAHAGGGFKGCVHHDILSRADATENTASVVTEKTLGGDLVTKLGTFRFHTAKAATDLNPLGGIDGHHRIGNIRIQSIENRLPQPRRHTFSHHRNSGTHRIAFLAQCIHIVFHRLDLAGIRREKRILAHLTPVVGFGFNRPQLRQVAADENIVLILEEFFRNRTGCHPHRGFAGRGTPPATVITEAVFLRVGVVGMAGTKGVGDIAVIFGALINVLDHQADGGAGGFALEHAGENFYLIRFAALGGVTRGAGATSIQILLDIRFVQLNTRRATINNRQQGRTMGFTAAGDCK